MEKYLIVGLGNPGAEYAETRHNTGYMILDAFAKASNICFDDKRYGYMAQVSVKGRRVFLLKPTTFMNLSGNAVRYWLNQENIPTEHLLVCVDDIAIPIGQYRLKGKGSAGGHNGLAHIEQLIGPAYARLRMGIGNAFPVGHQIDWVLGKFTEEEKQLLETLFPTTTELIKTFVLSGIDFTMNQFNNRGKAQEAEK